jgi:hypothetical protein
MSLSARFSLGLSVGALIATAALTGVAEAQSSAPVSLFTPGTERTEPPPGEGVRGMRPETVGAVAYFAVSPQASRSLRSPKPGPTQMRIALPGGKDVTCALTSDRASAGGITLSGSVGDDALSSCDLHISDGKVTGLIDTDAGRYRIMPVGKGGTHAVVEVKDQAFPKEEERVLQPPLPPAPDKRSMRDEAPCDVMPKKGKPKQAGPLRILVLYTQNAASDTADIKGDIALMMSRFNETLGLNRNFKVTAELAAALPVNYTEAGDMETDLDRLSGKVDGYFGNIRQIRDKYKADLVHMLIRGSGDACGIGWLLDPKRPDSADWGFSLSDRECAMGNYSFIHEIGHNLGLNHDRAVVTNAGSDEFNFGYVDIPHQIRTVMAYNDACAAEHVNCRRLPVYSTPNLFYKGLPLGKPADAADGGDYNAELLCRNAPPATKFAETR